MPEYGQNGGTASLPLPLCGPITRTLWNKVDNLFHRHPEP